MVQQGLHRARKAVSTGKFDIVIMDEVCVAIFFELLKTQDLLSLLEEKPESVELILTGRYCPPELIERKDAIKVQRPKRKPPNKVLYTNFRAPDLNWKNFSGGPDI
jgi:cob(I)alamin adenosyltransferase